MFLATLTALASIAAGGLAGWMLGCLICDDSSEEEAAV